MAGSTWEISYKILINHSSTSSKESTEKVERNSCNEHANWADGTREGRLLWEMCDSNRFLVLPFMKEPYLWRLLTRLFPLWMNFALLFVFFVFCVHCFSVLSIYYRKFTIYMCTLFSSATAHANRIWNLYVSNYVNQKSKNILSPCPLTTALFTLCVLFWIFHLLAISPIAWFGWISVTWVYYSLLSKCVVRQ